MSFCSIHVPLRPKPKERPRFTGKRTYTPKATLEYEEAVRYYYRRDCGREPTLKPVVVTLIFNFGIPKSLPKATREKMLGGGYPYFHRPDLDNIEKSVMDALNGVAYADDAQVVAKVSLKRFWERDSVLVQIDEMEEIDYESGVFAGYGIDRAGGEGALPSALRGQ